MGGLSLTGKGRRGGASPFIHAMVVGAREKTAVHLKAYWEAVGEAEA